MSRLAPEVYSRIEAAIKHYGDFHADLEERDCGGELTVQGITEFHYHIGLEEFKVDVWDLKKAAFFITKRWSLPYAGCIAMVWLNQVDHLCCPTRRDAYLEAIENIDRFEKKHGAVFSGVCF